MGGKIIFAIVMIIDININIIRKNSTIKK